VNWAVSRTILGNGQLAINAATTPCHRVSFGVALCVGVLIRDGNLMKNMSLFTRAALVALATLWVSHGAIAATCGQVSASATAKTEQKAIAQANRIGQQQTNRLDRQHGSDIEYQAARVACSQARNGVFCKITQRYCFDDGSGQDFPGNFGDPDQVDPNSPQCLKLQRQCNNGRQSSCIKYEGNCQND
jgi:hypothetical protein